MDLEKLRWEAMKPYQNPYPYWTNCKLERMTLENGEEYEFVGMDVGRFSSKSLLALDVASRETPLEMSVKCGVVYLNDSILGRLLGKPEGASKPVPWVPPWERPRANRQTRRRSR